MSIEREIGKGLSVIDNIVSDITRRSMSQGSVKNFEIFLTTPIDDYCLIDMADFQLQKHMLMNFMQKDNLIYLMGNSVSGISNKVSDETYDYNYSYTQDNNYLENFQRYDAKETTTRSGWRNDNIQKYVNHNQIYGETINIYPDDDDTGTGKFIESEKWDSYQPNRNPNSILKKTKDFFRNRKINTIISRFHTDAEVNPSMLEAAGMDKTAVLIATCLASFIGTLAMALLANYPFALAPGMGLNAYFAFTVCGVMGYSWQVALMAVFIEGLIFIVLSLTRVREAIFDAIPSSLKKGVGAGIGLFIAFIGLQGAHLVVDNSSTLVTYVNFTENWHTSGICAVLALIGLFITAILYIKGIKGSILIGILATWVLGMLAQATGIYVVDIEGGFYSLYPTFAFTDFTAIGKTFGQCFAADFDGINIFNFIVVLLSFLFVDMFDTIGTLIGVSSKAGMLDENEKLPRIRPALLADAIATSAGAVLGTSTTTTYVESSAGVGEGARTGLASVVTGLLFLLAIFFAPIFTAIPGFATAPALIFVGFLMVSSILKVDFEDVAEAVPAYLCLVAMPLMYSISEGIAIGVISYVIINVICGKAKKITPLMYVLAVLFVCKYIFL